MQSKERQYQKYIYISQERCQVNIVLEGVVIYKILSWGMFCQRETPDGGVHKGYWLGVIKEEISS